MTILRVGMPVMLLLSLAGVAHGQTGGPSADLNLAHPHEIVTAAAEGHTISGLVTHLASAKSFKFGVALFPGYPGIMKLREDNGRPQFELRGNFLIRARRHWLDDETLVVVVDAPSDQWATFSQAFRETPRYGTDVAALLREVSRRFNVDDWTFVGTSEGSVSAFHAARMNPALAHRLILTSSVFESTPSGPGLSNADFAALTTPLLWVHHESDPCQYTPYRDAKAFAEKTHSPLVTVRGGGPWRGGACLPFSAHGYAGIESETVNAMRSWIKTGATPADVGP